MILANLNKTKDYYTPSREAMKLIYKVNELQGKPITKNKEKKKIASPHAPVGRGSQRPAKGRGRWALCRRPPIVVGRVSRPLPLVLLFVFVPLLSCPFPLVSSPSLSTL